MKIWKCLKKVDRWFYSGLTVLNHRCGDITNFMIIRNKTFIWVNNIGFHIICISIPIKTEVMHIVIFSDWLTVTSNWSVVPLYITACQHSLNMMTSSNGNIFHVTGPLYGEFTGHRWIPLTKASDTELCYFHWSAPEPTVEQTMETPVNLDAIVRIMTSV